MRFKIYLTALMFMLISSIAMAQTGTVKGKVTEASTGEPAIGVSVLLKGTSDGAITDENGLYSIPAATSSGTLVFSFIGMKTQEVEINGRSEVNVIMQNDNVLLEDIVVVGYGQQNVKDLTSSISTIKSEELTKTPSGQAMQSLQGKVAGLQVVSSGAPGDSPTIRVRGIGSYPGSNNEAPLYVVDGMFFDNIDFLNPSEIATVSVLKDASAAAIYGVRAANGVVLIETKSGGINQKAKITYSGYAGVQVAQNVLKMANAEQFATMIRESGSASEIANLESAMQLYGRSRKNPELPNVNTDWYKEVLRPAAIQNHSITISGGNKKSTYSVGASYFAQEGILDMKNEYERYNLRSKVDYQAKSWLKVGANVMLSNADKHNQSSEAWNLAYFAVPILPVYDESNTQAVGTKYASAQRIGYRQGQNPFPSMEYNHRELQIMKLMGSFYAQFDIIPKKLTFKTTYNQNITELKERNVADKYFITTDMQNKNSSIFKKASSYTNITWDNVLTYTNSFDRHDITAMLGSSHKEEKFEMLQASGVDLPTSSKKNWYIRNAEEINEASVDDDGLLQYGISYFGRLSYKFDNKYLVYGTMRADGSSKYEEKWGYFPTIGAGWVVSEESFLKGNEYINFLKLRASWGELGNDRIIASDGANTTSVIETAINGTKVSGTTTTSTYSELEWEVTEEYNFGLTSALFDNRLNIDADYYLRDTKNATIGVNIPLTGGSVMKNVGVIRNSGFELAVNWSDKITDDFSYSVGANISTLKNEVKDLYGQKYIDGGSAEFLQRSMEGEPLLAFYGYETDGIYQNTAEIEADPVAVANGLEPGDFRFKDQNGDKVIDDKDRVVLGSYFPSVMYGFNLGITYKDFEFSTNISGQYGNKILNRKRGEMIWTTDGNMDADLAKNRWHGEGTSNKYPSSKGLRKGWNQKMSDYFVEDGAFFRVQNIQIAYNIRNKELFGMKIPETRISFTADKPLTIFSYNGFSPEVANGIDTQTYPIPAVYTVGLDIKF